ncbi:MAG: phosphate ABC transporter permease PstA [Planctomycetota bacterium]
MNPDASHFGSSIAARRFWSGCFTLVCGLTTLVGGIILLALVIQVVREGWPALSLKLFTKFPSVLDPENAGVKSALFGTLWLVTLTAAFSIPLGLGAAIYLEEYAAKTRLTRWIELNIANLAGVPSVVYGLLGLTVFVRTLGFGRSILAGALTLSLVVLPVMIIASREAIAAVPASLRSAAFALGATRWQTIRAQVLPVALPGILTGAILGLSRAIGEAAPLIVIGALAFVAHVPSGPMDQFTALPIQIFNWCEDPGQEFHRLAAAAIVVLLGVLIPLNAVAIGVRAWYQSSKKVL